MRAGKKKRSPDAQVNALLLIRLYHQPRSLMADASASSGGARGTDLAAGVFSTARDPAKARSRRISIPRGDGLHADGRQMAMRWLPSRNPDTPPSTRPQREVHHQCCMAIGAEVRCIHRRVTARGDGLLPAFHAGFIQYSLFMELTPDAMWANTFSESTERPAKPRANQTGVLVGGEKRRTSSAGTVTSVGAEGARKSARRRQQQHRAGDGKKMSSMYFELSTAEQEAAHIFPTEFSLSSSTSSSGFPQKRRHPCTIRAAHHDARFVYISLIWWDRFCPPLSFVAPPPTHQM